MAHVPGHDGEVVDERRRGEERVHIRQRRMCADFPPALGDSVIDGKYAIAEPFANICHPSVEHDAERRVAAADARSTAPKLADHQHAEIQLLGLAGPEPRHDPLIRALPLAQLGHHIGVKEIAHRSTGRGPERG